MFILNEKNIGIPLDTINLITLTYYSAKSEILNIYDTNFIFNENIVPLITSVLETKAHIIQAKKYTNVNSESVIIINNTNGGDSGDGGDGGYGNGNYIDNTISYNRSKLDYPCFFYDVQNNDKMQNIQGYNKKLISSLDANENALLIRMYNLEKKKGDFEYCVLNEEEMQIIIWNWEYANFQIIINKNTPKLCQLQVNIYITEDNKMISSKLEHINNILEKIDKIKQKLENNNNNNNIQ